MSLFPPCEECGSRETILDVDRDGYPVVCEDCGATVVVGGPAVESQTGP